MPKLMIDINKISYPAHKPCLRPTLMVIDAGYSVVNFKILSQLAETVGIENIYSDDFYGFFKLYDEVKQEMQTARDTLTEFGYSPYNLMLIIESLDLHKEDFAELIGCSFSKILANTTHRNNNYFRPMVGNQWQDLLSSYIKMVALSDEHYGLSHDADSLFFIRGNESLPISAPASIK